MTPLVDVIIPVHNASRPIERAVTSAVSGEISDVRVTVVCHGLDPALIEPRVAHTQVRVIAHTDGIASAAGPMNAGIAASDAEFVSRLDSDDWFDQGAISSWISAARASRADVVIAPLRLSGERPMYAPLTRPFRHKQLDGVKDRLAYRTAPFGLIRRQTLGELGAQYTPGLHVGEDLEFGLKLWMLAPRVDLDVHAPSYVVGSDAVDRATEQVRSISDELAALQRLIRQSWVQSLTPPRRQAIAVKCARIHLIGALRRRNEARFWTSPEIEWIHYLIGGLLQFSPELLTPLSRAETELIQTIRATDEPERLVAAIQTFAHAGRVQTLLTTSWQANADRESTLRRYLRYRLPR